jgi:hypothetical protein
VCRLMANPVFEYHQLVIVLHGHRIVEGNRGSTVRRCHEWWATIDRPNISPRSP